MSGNTSELAKLILLSVNSQGLETFQKLMSHNSINQR